MNPVFSRKTGDLLFSTDRSGAWDIVMATIPRGGLRSHVRDESTRSNRDDGGSDNSSNGSSSSDSNSSTIVVVASSPPSFNDRPSVDPSGQRVVFVSTRGVEQRADNVGWAALFVAPLPTTHIVESSHGVHPRADVGAGGRGDAPAVAVRITPPGETDYSPAWSPNGEWIAAANGTGDVGMTDIVVMRPDGTSRRVVASDGGWPTWAPNSSVIYFHRSENSDFHRWRVYAVDVDPADGAGGGVPATPRAVSPEGWSVLTPSAHPTDPHRLAVAAIINGTRHIAVLDLSHGPAAGGGTSTVTPVTPNRPGALMESAHWNPTWSNDGLSIVFSRCRGPGTTAPNLRAVASPLPDLAVRFVNGDFPQRSPDGEWLGLTGHGVGGMRGAFNSFDVMRPNGTSRRVVWDGPTWMVSWDPSPTPANGRIARVAVTTGAAFSSSFDVGVRAAIINVSGVDAGRVANLSLATDLNTGHPTFSPDGASVIVR
jgi:Tol biopolymer transport system component